jgi:hypothetical protein
MTLIELLVASTTMMLLVLGACALMIGATKQFYSTEADVDITQSNANGVRYVTQKLRQAMGITINSSGTQVSYTMPAYSNYYDDVTGERELLDPLTSDNVARSFTVSNGQLIDDCTGRVLVKNILAVDPDPQSSQYNQVYAPFQLTTIGSRRALTINLVTQRKISSITRFVRMKTTVIIRNGS